MSDLLGRLCELAFTYLLGFAFLRFCWACCRERPPVEQIARPIVIFFACTLAALFAWGLATGL
jgi:hypothetical protein